MSKAEIIDAVSDVEIAAAQMLFREYGSDVSREYCLQGFDEEVAGLPGFYAPPQGCLVLLVEADIAVGTVAFRRHDQDAAEMKRLYVQPSYVGKGYGRLLTQAAIERARQAKYQSLRLDTLAHMTEAQQLYKSMGFVDIAPYHTDTAPGMKFMELVL